MVVTNLKINVIYNLIPTLAQEHHGLVAPFILLDPRNKISSSEREAYLLKYSTAPNFKIYAAEGFVFSKRHLTIDKFYSASNSEKGQNGHAEAHYSEYYIHPETHEETTVHVFFTDRNSYIQIKHSLDNVEWYDIPGLLSPYIINCILNNAADSLNLYDQLKNEFATRSYQKAEELDKDEKRLSLFSKTLNTKSERQQYIDFGRTIIEKIEKLNDFGSTKLDVFKQQILDRISFVGKLAEEINLPAAPLLAEPAAEVPQASEPVLVKKPIVQKIDDGYQSAQFEKLQNLDMNFDLGLKNKRGDEVVRLASEIRLIVLEFNFFKKVGPEQKKLIQELERKIEPVSNADDYAYKKFVASEFESFTSVFSLLTNHQEFSLIKDIFEFILGQIEDQSELTESQRKMCDFLYENSVAYKLKLSVSKDAVIMLGTCGIAMSMISLLCMWDLKQTFSMLLRHGLGVCGIGCFVGNNVISVLRMAIATTEDPFYIQALLEHGATIDAPQSVWNSEQIKKLSTLVKEKFVKKINDESYEAFLKTFSNKMLWSSDLMTACSFDHFKHIPLLIDKSSYVQVALGLSMTSADPSVVCHREFCSQAGFLVYDSQREKESAVLSAGSSRNSIRSVFYPAPFEDSETPLRLQALRILIANFEQRALKTDAELLKILDELDGLCKNEMPENAKNILNACRLLICNKGPLNKAWAEKLARYFCLVGNAIVKMDQPSVASGAFCFAKKLGVVFEIGDCPVCVYAQKKMDELRVSDAPAFDLNLINLYLNKIIPKNETLEEDEQKASSSSNVKSKARANKKKK